MVFAAVRSALGSRAVVPSSRTARSIDYPYDFACRRRRPAHLQILNLLFENFHVIPSPQLHAGSLTRFSLSFCMPAPPAHHAFNLNVQYLNCLPKVSFHSASPIAWFPSELIFPIILHAGVAAGPPFPHFLDCLSHASVARHARFRVRTVLQPVGRWNTCSRARRQRAVQLSLGGLNR
eukprot:COSAG02_NODE_6363_length_3623_cov_7.028377_2_plen_178_part_00